MDKKFRLLLATATVAIASCTQENHYRISGTVENAADGDTVLIIAPTMQGMDTLHIATTTGGKFSVEGQADSTRFAYALYQAGEERSAQAMFFIESGDIKMSLDPDSTVAEVSGTVNNDLQNTMVRNAYTLEQAISDAYMRSMQAAEGSDEADFQHTLDSLQNIMLDMHKDFISKNIKTYVAQFYLANFGDQLGDDFFAEQVKALSEDDIVCHQLREAINIMKQKEITAKGRQFVDFAAPTPDGEVLSVSDVATNARVLMIDFWASWCGPCRAEMPNVKAAYQKYHEQGFEILGVSLDQDADAWKKAIADLGMTWPQISDLKGWDAHGAALYSVRAIPATVFIKDGIIVARDVRGEELGPKIEELLK